jgi:hypothetical protein
MIIGALITGLTLYIAVLVLVAVCGKALRGWMG